MLISMTCQLSVYMFQSQNSYKLTDLGEVSETVPVIVTHVELPNVVSYNILTYPRLTCSAVS